MKKKRKVPLRKCLGCNEMKPKKELIRIVRSPEGKVSIDKVGKAPGRGCYICPSLQCLETAVKGKRVQNALETPVEADLFTSLREQLSDE
ncbi:MAG TPA: YlxR family protein [Bacillota bacterium]|mgnify:CR=1 FL=1|nr:YlxR family protein [Bacillota bacterium]HPL53174.1 YlxR family protein [Bacillota bacterium]